jgi:hypothetical protein
MSYFVRQVEQREALTECDVAGVGCMLRYCGTNTMGNLANEMRNKYLFGA